MTQLETSRLILRPFRASDFEQVHAYASDPSVTQFQYWGPNSEKATREFLDRAQAWLDVPNPQNFEFAIVVRDEERVIGGCGVQVRRAAFRDYEIGWTLSRDYWRRGIGTEAARALIDFAIQQLDAHRLYALIGSENLASVMLAEKLGFRREGEQKSDSLVRGEWRDSFVYALLASDVVRDAV